MGYRGLQDCVTDLKRHRHLVQIDDEIDPNLEMAEIQRRVFQAGGPALLFTRPKSCSFPMLGNLFGTLERTRFLFRDALPVVQAMVRLKVEPDYLLRKPWDARHLLRGLWNMRPKFVRSGPVLAKETTISNLPKLVSWPRDGGPFITLPQVYTEDANHPGWRKSNLGMYRVQLSGNQYDTDREVGLHYQIHRGIGVHHAAAIAKGKPFRVNVFVGGPPSMTLAAVMPLPEGMPEITFAGALGGRRIRLATPALEPSLPIAADADFCISGIVDPQRQLPEGPFGDHLGYYSLQHPFPVLKVDRVWHRKDAIWPFTVVGRPPQEDTSFGQIIHELTGPVIPTVVHGIHAVHAVDAAGVHPLLLAQGSERYVPYAPRRKPQELLTSAHALLGQGQLSLAKYLLIVAKEDNPDLDIHDIPAFFRHLLERVDWTNDLHFQTSTTIDTLDYSGCGFNEGSKVVIAAAGPVRRSLVATVPPWNLSEGFSEPRLVLPGIVAIQGRGEIEKLCATWKVDHPWRDVSMVVVVDDSSFAAASLNNFLWVTFTRSDPARDIHGFGATTVNKHWGCAGPLVIDARIKPHHAPPLVEDPAVSKRVDALASRGGALHGIL